MDGDEASEAMRQRIRFGGNPLHTRTRDEVAERQRRMAEKRPDAARTCDGPDGDTKAPSAPPQRDTNE